VIGFAPEGSSRRGASPRALSSVQLTATRFEKREAGSRASLVRSLCDFLSVDEAPRASDLIFVLAGRPERKTYGLELFREGFAPRLILSVGRFEVRQVARLGLGGDFGLRELAARTPASQRHFFLDLTHDSRQAGLAGMRHSGTYEELSQFAAYLSSAAITSVTFVSTSIHLRRVRWCCQRIPGLRKRTMRYVPVPENASSFQREGWWKRPDHWSYLVSEYAKLVVYSVRYGRRG
jgi:hypothetical protein